MQDLWERVLQSTVEIGGLEVQTWQASPDTELLDDIPITHFSAAEDGPAFVRVCVVNPAENTTCVDHRQRAHRAVTIARHHLHPTRHPLAAISAAAAEMFDPHQPLPMCNPLCTVAWADVQPLDGQVLILHAGRVADSEVLVSGGSHVRRVFDTPMWTPEAERRWTGWVNAHDRLDSITLWNERERQVNDPACWLNPPLGQALPVRPEWVDLLQEHRVVLATDGLEFAEDPMAAMDPGAQVQRLMARVRPANNYSPQSHGDLAAAVIQVASTLGWVLPTWVQHQLRDIIERNAAIRR